MGLFYIITLFKTLLIVLYKNKVAINVQIEFPIETWNPKSKVIQRDFAPSPAVKRYGKSIIVPIQKDKIAPTIPYIYSDFVTLDKRLYISAYWGSTNKYIILHGAIPLVNITKIQNTTIENHDIFLGSVVPYNKITKLTSSKYVTKEPIK